MLPIVVLLSGNGSNLQAIIDSIQQGFCPAHIQGVVSDNPSAFGLQRASQAGIPACALSRQDYPDAVAFEEVLVKQIATFNPKLIVLAGFMRILSPLFIAHFPQQIINIHPSLLPAYRGLNTHRRVLAAGEKEHGVSIHWVTEDLDAGPLILQAKFPIQTSDTEESLRLKVQAMEHRLYPLAIRWYAEGKIHY